MYLHKYIWHTWILWGWVAQLNRVNIRNLKMLSQKKQGFQPLHPLFFGIDILLMSSPAVKRQVRRIPTKKTHLRIFRMAVLYLHWSFSDGKTLRSPSAQTVKRFASYMNKTTPRSTQRGLAVRVSGTKNLRLAKFYWIYKSHPQVTLHPRYTKQTYI